MRSSMQALVIIVLFITNTVMAQQKSKVITLSNGSTLAGNIVAKNDSVIQVRAFDGTIFRLLRSDVLKISDVGDVYGRSSGRVHARKNSDVGKTDVLYLRNGSIIRGRIVEVIPNENVKIITADGSLFVFDFSAVLRITSEQIDPVESETFRAKRLTSRTIAGRGLLISWAASVFGAAAMGDQMLATTIIPIVGPWVTQARVEGMGGEYLPGGKTLLTLSGVIQGGFCIWWVSTYISKDASSKYELGIMPDISRSGVRIQVVF